MEIIDSCLEKTESSSQNLEQQPITNQDRRTDPSLLQHWLGIFRKITRSTGLVVRIEKNKKRPSPGSSDHVYGYELSLLGAQIINALDNFWPYATPHLEPELHYAPSLRLLFESAQKRALKELISAPYNDRVAMIWCSDIINGYVNDIREQAASARFRERQKEFARGPNDNLRWIKSIVEECFLGNEYLRFACMDLHHINPNPTLSADIYKQVKANGKALCEHLGKQLLRPDGILGYGLNLRYVPVQGYQYRLLVISRIDGKPMEQQLTDAIGNAWQQIAGTNSVAMDLFQNNKLKTIHRDHVLTRKDLKDHLHDLTLLDSLVRLKLAPKDHHFFRGEKRG